MSGLEVNGRAVPAAAELVHDFVNTVEWQTDEDRWRTPADVASWFKEHTDRVVGGITTDDVVLARRVREGLRSMLLINAGHDPLATSIDALNEVLVLVPLRMRFDESGSATFSAAPSSGFTDALAVILEAIETLRGHGGWPRLKACSRDSCRWAYWDSSRNMSGRWCSMVGCGNYVKMRRRNTPERADGDVIPGATGGTRVPTLVDVAARAGVSIKTASNVVTGAFPVAEATRSRVQAAVDDLGYRPNLAARSLRARRSS